MVRGGEIGVFGGALVRLHCGAQVDAALLWGPEGPAVPKRGGASSRGWLCHGEDDAFDRAEKPTAARRASLGVEEDIHGWRLRPAPHGYTAASHLGC